MNKVIVITGPTATGKTALGVFLAQKLGGEVVSADSMQIYKGMDIGTAKPTHEEMQGVLHHMIDVADPAQNYSVAQYVSDASACVDDILARGKTPIIVGGTGLYINSLLKGEEFSEAGDPALRDELSQRFDSEGGEKMLAELAKYDPERAAKLHPNDKNRIVRALLVFLQTGETISAHDAASKQTPARYDAVKIALSFENREDLYERINRRVDLMLEAGLRKEIEALLASGLPEASTAMQAIGYKELILAMRGKCSINDAIEKIKMESRRYAKRQLSWLRRDESVNWILWDKSPDFAFGLHASTNYLVNNGYNIAVNT